MIKRIQELPQWQRVIIFTAGICLVVALLFAGTVAVAWYGVNGAPRSVAVAMQDSVTVREFADLPDDDSFPAALAIDSDGLLYTGSYVSGTVWEIDPEGTVTELSGTRDAFGSVTGLTVGLDHTLYVFDRMKPLQPEGAIIWRILPNSTPEKVVEIPANPAVFPYDLTTDDAGNLYATFFIHGDPDYVARYAPDGTGGVWWNAPAEATLTGITFDAANHRLLVTDTVQNVIYGLPLTDGNATPTAEEVYRVDDKQPAPGLDGLTVDPEGNLYIAAPGLNRVAHLNLKTGVLDYLAGGFRGSSRVAYDANNQRLYVNNWDQRALIPDQVLFVKIAVNPRLPFSIDAVEPK